MRPEVCAPICLVMSMLCDSPYFEFLSYDAQKLVYKLQNEINNGYNYVFVGLGSHITEDDHKNLRYMDCEFKTYHNSHSSEPEYVLEYHG